MNGVGVVVVISHHRGVSFKGRCFCFCYNLCYTAMGIIVVFTLIVMILVVLSRVSFDGREATIVAYEWRTCHVFIAVYEHTTEPTAVKVKCSIAMGLRKKKCSAFLLLVSIFMDRQQLAWFHYMPSICKMLSMFAVHKFV